MKKSLIIFIFLISFFSCSQEKSPKASIESDFNNYIAAIQNKKIDEAITFLYPKFFEVVPKNQLKKMLELTYNNPQLEVLIKNFKIKNIKNIEEIRNEYFTTINYSFAMDLKLNNDQLKNQQSILQNRLESKFGSANVQYNPSTYSFHILSDKKAICISQNGKNDWKFLVIENEYKPYLMQILPEKILKEN